MIFISSQLLSNSSWFFNALNFFLTFFLNWQTGSGGGVLLPARRDHCHCADPNPPYTFPFSHLLFSNNKIKSLRHSTQWSPLCRSFKFSFAPSSLFPKMYFQYHGRETQSRWYGNGRQNWSDLVCNLCPTIIYWGRHGNIELVYVQCINHSGTSATLYSVVHS